MSGNLYPLEQLSILNHDASANELPTQVGGSPGNAEAAAMHTLEMADTAGGGDVLVLIATTEPLLNRFTQS